MIPNASLSNVRLSAAVNDVSFYEEELEGRGIVVGIERQNSSNEMP